jgi:hypothetical protein
MRGHKRIKLTRGIGEHLNARKAASMINPKPAKPEDEQCQK